MPMITGGFLAGAGLVGIGLVFALGKKKKKKKNGRGPWTEPIWVPVTPEDQKIVTDSICARGLEVAALKGLRPEQRKAKLAELVWGDIWPGVPWPVIATDHESVQNAAMLLGLAVESYYNLGHEAFCANVEPEPGPDPSPGPEPEPGPEPDPDIPDEDRRTPEDFPTDNDVDPYPTPGAFYQVSQGDYFLGTNSDHSIVYRALLSLGFLAAKAEGLDDDAAMAAASSVANNDAMRARYRNLIQCSAFNDMLYGTYGYKQGVSMPSSHGRAIRLLPMHADNRQRYADGQLMIRKISMGTKSKKGDGTGTGPMGSLEFLWMPAVELHRVLGSGSADERLVPTERPDGSTGMVPPWPMRDQISKIGIPAGSYGCAPWTESV